MSDIEERWIQLHQADNVGTALTDLEAGSKIATGDAKNPWVSLSAPIRFGHKFALAAIYEGEAVIKYGISIGAATQHIKPGEHVHVHNMRSLAWEEDQLERIQESGWKNRHT